LQKLSVGGIDVGHCLAHLTEGTTSSFNQVRAEFHCCLLTRRYNCPELLPWKARTVSFPNAASELKLGIEVPVSSPAPFRREDLRQMRKKIELETVRTVACVYLVHCSRVAPLPFHGLQTLTACSGRNLQVPRGAWRSQINPKMWVLRSARLIQTRISSLNDTF